MRKLLAPALTIALLSLMSAAQATTTEETASAPCLAKSNPPGTVETLDSAWDFGGYWGPGPNRVIKLLHRFTVTNNCDTWAVARFNDTVSPTSTLAFAVAPFTTKTIGNQGLMKLGYWQYAYEHSFPKAPVLYQNNPCNLHSITFWINADGHVTAPSC